MGTALQRATSFLLYGGTFRLRPYEDKCLTAWENSLPRPARDVLKRQIRLLDRFKRAKEGRTLYLYPTGWPNGQPLPAEVRFALQEVESRVARVRMEDPQRTNLRADAIIVLQNGQLTSVEFSNELPRDSWESALVRDVVLLRDVLSPSRQDHSGHQGSAPQKLAWLMEAHSDSSCNPPRTSEEVRAFIGSFDTKFPPDFEALLRTTNGVSAGPVQIFGIGEAWMIPRPDGPFVAIANVRGVGELATKIGDRTGTVYLLVSESDEAKPLVGSFMDVVRESAATLLQSGWRL